MKTWLFSASGDSTINVYLCLLVIKHCKQVWDLTTLSLIRTLNGHSDAVLDIVADDTSLYSGSSDHTLRVVLFYLFLTIKGLGYRFKFISNKENIDWT